MELGEIYSSRVSGKSNINFLCFGGHVPNIERDPYFDKLENNVLMKFNEIIDINKNKDEITANTPIIVNSFGFEDALKELISLKNKGFTSS